MENELKSAGQAPFERIAQELRSEIKSGKLAADSQLPNQREIAARFEVAVGTAQRALSYLQEEGWIISRPGVGRVVSSTPGREPVTLEQLAKEVASLRERVEQLEGGD